MSRPYRQTDFEKETKSFEAFDLLTTALTDIDKYQSSKYKDKRLLNAAADSISKALEADEHYFKAQYFQAVVKYLQGNNDEAIREFYGLFDSHQSVDVLYEIQYNIAVANSDAGKFEPAIQELESLTKTEADPETKLLARAALVQTFAKRIKDPKYKDDTKTLEHDGEEIKKRKKEIEKTLTSTQTSRISGSVKREVKQILDGALNENVNFPHRRRRRLGRLFRGYTLIVLIAVLIFILYVFLYIGLHNIFG